MPLFPVWRQGDPFDAAQGVNKGTAICHRYRSRIVAGSRRLRVCNVVAPLAMEQNPFGDAQTGAEYFQHPADL